MLTKEQQHAKVRSVRTGDVMFPDFTADFTESISSRLAET